MIGEDVAGYPVTAVVHEGRAHVVYRARHPGGTPVVLKVLRDDAATSARRRRLENELDHLRRGEGPGVIGARELLPFRNTLVLVLEDFGARSLLERLDTPPAPALGEALHVAIEATRALAHLHARGIIHGDVSPGNILVGADGRTIKLCDLGLSSRSAEEHRAVVPTRELQGTLPYLAPEQTGRVNRPVDERSDLYGLGATLYHLFAGRPPFAVTGSLALIHAHLAQAPAPLHEVAPQVPRVLSAIAARLLAKAPEDRYQSAAGLLADLVRVRDQLGNAGGTASFPLGSHDVSRRVRLSRKLYGRAGEIRVLLEALERAAHGEGEAVLVRGYSGIGKSALVDEARRLSRDPGGFFVAGKFEQYQRDVPYAALANAIEGQVRRVLGEGDEDLARWRERAIAAVGDRASFLAAIAPGVTHLLGPAAPRPGASPAEALTGLHEAVRTFLGAFAEEGKPLVLFLDDLQWADPATLALIERLMEDPAIGHVLLAFAYRDNEVDANHPVARMLDRLRGAPGRRREIALTPLDEPDVTAWLADTLGGGASEIQPFARVVLEKTAGNPFFVGKFLEHLHAAGWLSFDTAELRWRWDLPAIERAGITNNVVDLLVSRIETQPEETRHTLSVAAVLGHRFSMVELAELTGRGQGAVNDALAPAFEARFVVAAGEGAARFHHDRIQEAAARFVPAAEAARLQWAIATKCLATGSEEEQEARIFELASRLNQGLPAGAMPEERLDVARTDLRAARRARLAGAYDACLWYAGAGLGVLPPDAWERARPLALALQLEAHAGACLTGQFERSDALYRELTARERDFAVVGEAHLRTIQQHVFQMRYRDALDLGLGLLAELGFPVLLDALAPEILAETERYERALVGTSFEALLDRAPARDPRVVSVVALMADLAPAAFFVDPLIVMLFGPRAATLLIEEGTAPGMGYLVAALTLVYLGLRDDHRSAFETALFAIDLARRAGDRLSFGRATLQLAVVAVHWMRHLREGASYGHEAFEALDENRSQNLQFLVFTFYASVTARLEAGEPLGDVEKELTRALLLCEKTNDRHARGAFLVDRQVVRALTGKTTSPSSLDDGEVTEAQLRAELAENKIALASFLFHKLELANFSGEEDAALELTAAGAEVLPFVLGFYLQAVYHFHAALALARKLARALPDAEREGTLAVFRESESLLERWATLAPMNFEHKLALVRAERERAMGSGSDVLALYEAAIRGAREQGFVHEEGLAAERAAAYCREHGYLVAADGFLDRAVAAYSLWGATAKVERLVSGPARRSSTSTDSGSSGDGVDLDIEAVARAVTAVAWELDQDRLVRNLVLLAVENAGAERCVLLLAEEGALRAVAEADSAGVRPLSGAHDDDELDVPRSVVDYVRRTRKPLQLEDQASREDLDRDPYLRRVRPRSLLGMPILKQGRLSGILYFENRLTPGLFDPKRVRVLGAIAGQAAIALENARLHADLERRVEARTAELAAKNAELEREVAERLRVEHELVAANERVTEAARAKGTFLATMSHEIRTPMNAVIGMTGLLIDTSLDGRQRELVDTIRSSGEHLVGLINDILDFSKIEAGKLELERQVFDLRVCVEEVLELLAPRANEKRLRLAHVCDPAIPPALWGDAGRLRQVLVNLAGNAVKFTERGEVVVELRALQVEGAQHRIHVLVRDTGIGIPADRIGQLFAAFTQVDASTTRQYGGTGLGLAISKRLVEVMGGEIWVESELGKGAIFHFTFAAEAAPASALPARVPVSAPERITTPLRILLAEDNQVNQRLALLLLEKLGQKADTVASGAEAVLAVTDRPYDVVLMDVLMPEMDGLAATRAIRSTLALERQPRIIAMTANALAGDRERCLDAGMDDYVGKPVKLAELAEALRRCRPRVPRNTLPPPSGGDLTFDATELDALVGIIGAEAFAALVPPFLAEAEGFLSALDTAAHAGDAAALHQVAHQLKSTGSSFGGRALGSLCAEIERLARAGDAQTAARLVPRAHEAFAELVETLKAYTAS